MEENRSRINKYLAACGICSRRQADELVAAGKVMINGIPAVPGQTVSMADDILVNGKRVAAPERHVVLAYYKPAGVVCTERDKYAEKTVITELGYTKRLTYAGRLDKDSEGLLIMTDDGDLIQAITKSANRHEKEYIVRVDREISEDDIAFWAGGVYLKELDRKTRPCKVEKLGSHTAKFVLTQGLNRQIRRMCRARNFSVVSLKRTRVMNVFLASLQPGEYREIQGDELKELYDACGILGN